MAKIGQNYAEGYGNDLAVKKLNIALLPTCSVSSNSPFNFRED